MEPDKRIVSFIRRHHVLTLATCDQSGLWCANIFYAWMERDGVLVFTTGAETRHSAQMELNPNVAASVVLETRVVGRVQGLQMTGRAERPQGDMADRARKAYLRRFPYAAAMGLDLWMLRPDYMKLTDNRLGFGKKLIWNGEQ